VSIIEFGVRAFRGVGGGFRGVGFFVTVMVVRFQIQSQHGFTVAARGRGCVALAARPPWSFQFREIPSLLTFEALPRAAFLRVGEDPGCRHSCPSLHLQRRIAPCAARQGSCPPPLGRVRYLRPARPCGSALRGCHDRFLPVRARPASFLSWGCL